MTRKLLSLIVAAVAVASFPAWTEVTRFPFFLPSPVFAGGDEAFPEVVAWAEYAQALNQSSAPDSAHWLDAAALFTFYSSEGFAVRGLVREMFQFKRHPDGDFLLWGRAVVTDLRLDLSVNLRPFVASIGYRHDCKHDVETRPRGRGKSSADLPVRGR